MTRRKKIANHASASGEGDIAFAANTAHHNSNHLWLLADHFSTFSSVPVRAGKIFS
jgi:hypothetical protein